MRKPVSFVTAVTNQGTFIVNRNDYCQAQDGVFGVGYQLLNFGSFDPKEIDFTKFLLSYRRKYFGDGVVALDCGANIGAFSIEWGREMAGWGNVLAFEAQEFTFYALAGNVVLNNCFNVSVRHCALDKTSGVIRIPKLDPASAASFGSLELRHRDTTEYIGQEVSYEDNDLVSVSAVALDDLNLQRVDLIKLDVEGMEEDVLQGCRALLIKHKPILWIEVFKSDLGRIAALLQEAGYDELLPLGADVLLIHPDDPTRKNCILRDGQIYLSEPD